MQRLFSRRSAFAARWPIRYAQGKLCGARKGFALSVPSTYEPAWRKSCATLARRTGLLSAAPCRGWCFADLNVMASIFIFLGSDVGPTASVLKRPALRADGLTSLRGLRR